MTKRSNQLREDRALRDAAKGLFQANVQHLRGFFEVNANTDRLTQRATDEFREMASSAGKSAGKHKGAIAFLAAAVVLWVGRDEIISLLDRSDKSDDSDVGNEDSIGEIENDEAEPEMEEAI